MTSEKPDADDIEATLPSGRPALDSSSEGMHQGVLQPFEILSCGRTDVGLRRKNNEDAFLVNDDLRLCILADGMGGAAAGELASHIFAQTAFETFSQQQPNSDEQNLALLQQTYQMANERILSHVRDNPAHTGMGCTAEVLRFHGERFAIGHVGDSRIYLFRRSELKQLTRDHSLVQDQVDQGLITAEEARKHRLRNVILRAVGTKENLAVDLLRGRAFPGDVFLLCSDGLTDMVEDSLIREVLTGQEPLPDKVDRLIALANEAGGHDNITVILSEVLSNS